MDSMTGVGWQPPADVQGRRLPDYAPGLWWLGQASLIARGAGMTV
jgi:hypothetical protein